MASKDKVIQETTRWIQWWLDERKKKLREHLNNTMAVNPFLMPIVYDLHGFESFGELNDLAVVSHLMTGHSTGFGKLMDEKILPNVFGTFKLDARYRRENRPLIDACFDEVDHIVVRPRGKSDLLSLKAGRWTIQLTMAVQLNRAFAEIIEQHGDKYGEIAVGVAYGKACELTDKYDILRGINRGKKHAVADLKSRVKVYCGRDFWTWINNGQEQTQEWLLEGIQSGLAKDNSRRECRELLAAYHARVRKTYGAYMKKDGHIDWTKLLEDVNG